MIQGIESYLKSERTKLERIVARLEEECEARPRGALVMKRRGSGEYAYVVRREDGRVVTRYVGKAGSWQARTVDAKLAERRKYEEELDLARTELMKITRMLKAGGIFFD